MFVITMNHRTGNLYDNSHIYSDCHIIRIKHLSNVWEYSIHLMIVHQYCEIIGSYFILLNLETN